MNLIKQWEALVKNSLLITPSGMQIWIWHYLVGQRTNGLYCFQYSYKFCPIVAQTMIKNSQNVVKNTTTFKRSIHFFLFLTDSCCERNLRHWILSLSSATVWLDHYISAGFMVLIQPCKTTWHEFKRTFPFFHCLEYVNISSEGKRRSLRWNRMIAWV